MEGPTRGRFGITRDADGSLSSIYEWPWYWRYAAAIAIEAVTIAAAVYLSNAHHPMWMIFGSFGAGSLIALGVAFELFILLIFAAVVWGFVKLVGTILPDSSSGSTIEVVSFLGVGYIAYAVYGIAKDVAETKRLQIATAQAIDVLMERSNADLYWRSRPTDSDDMEP